MSRIATLHRATAAPDPSWLHTLETFHVAFIVYGDDGRREHLSEATMGLLLEDPDSALVLQATDRLAAEEARRDAQPLRIGPFARGREIEFPASRLVVSLYSCPIESKRWQGIAVLRPRPDRRTATVSGLSRRENDVARLIAAGLSTKEIARRLGISPHTARHHTERIFARLGVTTRAAVAAIVATTVAR